MANRELSNPKMTIQGVEKHLMGKIIVREYR
jgi:hypothetical protein